MIEERSFDAEVVRHELPRTLPGYITVTLIADKATFETNVIETDDSEDFFAIGERVPVTAATAPDGRTTYSTMWRLHGAPRKQRLTLIRD